MVSLRLSIPAEAPCGAAPLAAGETGPKPPLGALTGLFTLPEDAAQGAVAGTVNGRTHGSILSLVDDAGGRVALAGTTIVRGATALDHETAGSHGFTLREILSGAPNSPRDSVLTLAVTNVPDAPALAALTLSAASLMEGAAHGTPVGSIQGKTAGSSLALTSDAGGRFQLNGLAIEAGPVATDFETAAIHAVTIRETLADSPNSPRDTTLTIAITEAEAPEPPAEAITAMVMGQSELEYLFNPALAYRNIAQPVPGDGNLIVWTQTGAESAPVRTVVNADSVAAGQVNPAMAAVSALLAHVRPGQLFAIGDGSVPGTARYDLADDGSDGDDARLWGDFASVVDAVEAEFGPVGHLIECWYNSDAAHITSFRESFWPFYFGAQADGTPFALGGTVNGRRIDHCLWDAAADPAEKGRGLFTRAAEWHIATPMPFLDAPVAPAAEMDNFSANNPRMREPARATMHALAQDALAQSVNLRIGPSAHLCRFGGGSTEIHPDRYHADGQVLMAWPAVAIPLLRASGMAIGEPTIVGIEGPADGSYVDVLVDLPNGGELTTLAALRGTEYAGSSPHQQDVTGFEITRAGGQRRPVFRTDQADRPTSHRGALEIVDAGSGSPRRGRIRITPEEPFAFGDSVSFLRGQATAALLEPRDLDLYPWFPIEHVPALFDASATYPMEGIALRPYQEEAAVPVEAADFHARGVYFDGASHYASTSGTVATAGSSGLASFWLRSDDSAWNATVGRRIFQLRVGSVTVIEAITASSGRITFRLNNDTAADTVAFFAAQPGNGQFAIGAWYHVLIGWTATGAVIFVNNMQVATMTFASLDMAGQTITQIGIGSESSGNLPWLGDLAHLYINLTETLDLTDPANRARFIKDGAPVDLGANGELPTGSAPAIYYDGDPPAWANQGMVSNIPLIGSLRASELAPML